MTDDMAALTCMVCHETFYTYDFTAIQLCPDCLMPEDESPETQA